MQKTGAKIQSITMLSGNIVRGEMFIDATYEGDLMAAAGVDFTVGREPNAKYGETLNGVQTKRAMKHQFEKPIDPYVVPGDPAMSEATKLEKLFALVSLAFLFSYGWGCQLRAGGKTPKAVKRKSLFRQGLEGILRLLGNPNLPDEEYREFLEWLKQPVYLSIFVV